MTRKQCCSSLAKPSRTEAHGFRISANIHKNPIASRPIDNINKYNLSGAGVKSSTYSRPSVERCKYAVSSHQQVIAWADKTKLSQTHLLFALDAEALSHSTQTWLGQNDNKLVPSTWWKPSRPDLVGVLVQLTYLVLSNQLIDTTSPGAQVRACSAVLSFRISTWMCLTSTS